MLRTAVIVAAVAAAAVPASSPVSALAGRYSHHFKNGLVDGSVYWSDDVVEIAEVDAQHAYVRMELAFYNGHICSLAGIARAEGDALVYRGPADDSFAGGAPCRLTLRRKGADLSWNDDNSCKAHCGARGSLMDGSLPWSSKRPITYMERLKASQPYHDALTEWRAARPAPGGAR